jgi:hypothetical protein
MAIARHPLPPDVSVGDVARLVADGATAFLQEPKPRAAVPGD